MNMYTGLSLPFVRVGKDGDHANEWPAFKRKLTEQIKARKRHSPVMYVLDRAYIDIAFLESHARDEYIYDFALQI